MYRDYYRIVEYMNKYLLLGLLIIIVIIMVIYILSKSQKEGFWSMNYGYNAPYPYPYPYSSPCVQDMFGYTTCDPVYNYMYPGYFYTPNPYIYNSPEVMYRRILY